MVDWTPRISGRPGPRYLAIVESLAESLERGRLEPGARLPTQRALAKRLGLTVGTVTRAYAEAERRGLVEGQVGRGTFVREAGPVRARPETEQAPNGALDFSRAGALAGPFADTFERVLVRAVQEAGGKDGAAAVADAERAATRWLRLTSGVKATPERIVLARGAGLAISALLQRIADDEQQTVVAAEEVTARAAAAALRALDLRTQPVIVDDEGASPESLELACWASGARTVLIAPDGQEPAGARLTEERRHAVVDIARRYDLWIVENGVYAPLEETALAPLVNLAPERTYHIFAPGSILHPGLDLAGIVTPTMRREPLTAHLAGLGASASALMAAAFTDWAEDHDAADALSWQRQEAARRRDLAANALETGGAEVVGGAGYGLWLRLPPDTDGDELRAKAREQGVRFADTRDFWTGRGRAPNRLFLGLSGIAGTTAFERALPGLAGLFAKT